MSRIYPINDRQSFTLYNNGIKISREVDGHLRLEGGRNDIERVETLLVELERLAGQLRQSIYQGDRYHSDETIMDRVLSRYQTILELRNQLQHFQNNPNLPLSLKHRIAQRLNDGEFSEIRRELSRGSFLHLGRSAVVESVFGASSSESSTLFSSSAIRIRLHSLVFQNMRAAREALAQVAHAQTTEDREQHLLDAIRFYHRAKSFEASLMRTRPGLPIHSVFGAQLNDLREDIHRVPNFPEAFDVDLDYEGSYDLQHDYRDRQRSNERSPQVFAAVRLFFAFAQRISEQSPEMALRYLDFLEPYVRDQLAIFSSSSHLPHLNDFRLLLSQVEQLRRGVSERVRNTVGIERTSAPVNGVEERHTFNQLLLTYPDLLHECPFLTVFLNNSEIVQRFSRMSPVREHRSLFLRMLTDDQLEIYLDAVDQSHSLSFEDFSAIPFERMSIDAVLQLMTRDRYFVQRLMDNRARVIDCLDRMPPNMRERVWSLIREELIPTLANLPEEVRERCESYESFKTYLQDAHLLHSLNLEGVSFAQWLELAYNYHHLEEVRSTHRSIALVTISRKRDDNDAIQTTEREVLHALLQSRRFHVVYIPVGSDVELHSALATTVQRSGRRIQKWFLSAHGNDRAALFGDEAHEEENYDVSDLTSQFADLPNFFEPHAEIVHNVCENGEGGEENPNNLSNQEFNLFRRVGQSVTIHAIRNEASLEQLNIGSEGRFEIRWSHGNQGYRIQ